MKDTGKTFTVAHLILFALVAAATCLIALKVLQS